jgi:L-2,4-diaminobutyrate decarboxylase
MLVPSLVTAVLFREGRHSYQTFAQEASYLFAPAHERPQEWFNLGVRTLECTKDVMVAKLYLSLLVHGTRLFADHIDATFDLARRFARRITETPGFELATSPEANIVCFRYAPVGLAPAERDALQTRIRQRLVESGRFYLVQTRLADGVYLRTTLINPLTSDADLAALLDAIRDDVR